MPATVLRFVMNVSDFDGVVTFFDDVLDVEHVGGWDRGPDDRGALLEVCPGGVIEVVGHGAAARPASYRHDALAVQVSTPAEVDAFFRRCSSAGAPTSPPTQQAWGHYSSSARGPLGLELVVFCEHRDGS